MSLESMESVLANPPPLVGDNKEMETEDKARGYDHRDMEDGELPEDGQIVDEEERGGYRKGNRHHEREREHDNGFEEGEGSNSDSDLSKRARKRRRQKKKRAAEGHDDDPKKKKKKHEKKERKKYVDHDRVEEEGEEHDDRDHDHRSSHRHHHHKSHHHHEPQGRDHNRKYDEGNYSDSPSYDNQDRTPEYDYDDYDDFDDMEPPYKKKTMMSYVDDGFVDPSSGMGDRQEMFEHHRGGGRGRGPGRGNMRGGRGRGRGRGQGGRGRGRGRGGRGMPHGPPQHQHHDHGDRNQRGPPNKRRDDMKQNRPLCKFFLEGFCHKGDGCSFSHEATPAQKLEVCKFFLVNQCRKGDNCLYIHSAYPCKYFHTGAKCFQGDNCKFSHAPLDDQGEKLLQKVLREQSERDKDKERHDRHHEHHKHMPMNDMDENMDFRGSPPHMYDGDPNESIPSLLDIKVRPPSPSKGGHGPPGPAGPRPHGPCVMLRPGFYKDTLASPTRPPGPHGPGMRPPLLPDPHPRGMPPPHMRMPPPPPTQSAANVVSAMAEAIASAIRTHQKEALKAKEEKESEQTVAESVPKPSDLIKPTIESVQDSEESYPKPEELISKKPAPDATVMESTDDEPGSAEENVSTPAVAEQTPAAVADQAPPTVETKQETMETEEAPAASTESGPAKSEPSDGQPMSDDHQAVEAEAPQVPDEVKTTKEEPMDTSDTKQEEVKDKEGQTVSSPTQEEAKPEKPAETKSSFPEIPDNLPAVQRQLLLRLQQTQKEPEPPQENPVNEEKENIDDDKWYSSDEEEDEISSKSLSDIVKNVTQQDPTKTSTPPPAKPPATTAAGDGKPSKPVMDIGSMLSMIRQQTVSATAVKTPPAPSVPAPAAAVPPTSTAAPARRDPRLLNAPAPRIDPRTLQPPASSATASPRQNEPTPEIYGVITNPKPFRLVLFTMEHNFKPCLPPGLNITDPRYREDPRLLHYKNTMIKRSSTYQPSPAHGDNFPGHLRPPAAVHRSGSASSDSGMDPRLRTQNSAPAAIGARDPRMLQSGRPFDPRTAGNSSPAAHRTVSDPRAPPVPKLVGKDPRLDLQNQNSFKGFEMPPASTGDNVPFAMPKLLLEPPEPLKAKQELQSTPQSPLPSLPLPPLLVQPPASLSQPLSNKSLNIESGLTQDSPPALLQSMSPRRQDSEISSPPSNSGKSSNPLSHRIDPRFKRRPSVKNPEPEPVPFVNENKSEQRRQNVEYTSPLSGQSNHQEDSYSTYNRRPNNYEKPSRKGGKPRDPRQSNDGGQDPRQRRDPRFQGSGDPHGHSDPRNRPDSDVDGDQWFQQGGDSRFSQSGPDSQFPPGGGGMGMGLQGAGNMGINIDMTDPRFQQITGLPPEVFAQMQRQHEQQNEQSLREVFKTFDPTASPFC